jgi:hypothetical protein
MPSFGETLIHPASRRAHGPWDLSAAIEHGNKLASEASLEHHNLLDSAVDESRRCHDTTPSSPLPLGNLANLFGFLQLDTENYTREIESAIVTPAENSQDLHKDDELRSQSIFTEESGSDDGVPNDHDALYSHSESIDESEQPNDALIADGDLRSHSQFPRIVDDFDESLGDDTALTHALSALTHPAGNETKLRTAKQTATKNAKAEAKRQKKEKKQKKQVLKKERRRLAKLDKAAQAEGVIGERSDLVSQNGTIGSTPPSGDNRHVSTYSRDEQIFASEERTDTFPEDQYTAHGAASSPLQSTRNATHYTPSASLKSNVGLRRNEAGRHEVNEELTAALYATFSKPELPRHVSHQASPAFNQQVLQQPGWLQPGFLGASASLPNTPSKQSLSQPLVIREASERNIALRLKLIRDFGTERRWLASPVPLANHTSPQNGGVHVFIDFSNIWVGFMDIITKTRQQYPQHNIPHSKLDFGSFVLLLERGRPVAKRILAGSSPHLPAFDTAKAIGYEMNVLDKVFKARELTERQRRFRATNSANASEAETPQGTVTAASAAYANEKWVEQGVDEILHLKMLESIVDADDFGGPGTMVLATGDAAEAEYSAGFFKMVERALKKGWSVELMGWSKAISMVYRRQQASGVFGDQFRVVEMDAYTEYLLET